MVNKAKRLQMYAFRLTIPNLKSGKIKRLAKNGESGSRVVSFLLSPLNAEII
jgi:hypothetical protein